jgi:glycosyltransferase involved in cell wall biosynthesis
LKKIAFIVQRYGQEVSGGAEYHCRLLAERLTPYYNVTVITNCAVDYEDWDNYYQPGRDELNGVEIIRFKNDSKRFPEKYDQCSNILKEKRYNSKGWRKIMYRLLDLFDGKSLKRARHEWFRVVGPFCPDLISFLEKRHTDYDKLIFFTYLYYPTAMGIDVAPRKSILIPTAHDERDIYLPIFKNVFTKPSHILYNSHWEKAFVERMFHNSRIPNQVVGVGVEKPGLFAAKEDVKQVDFNDPYFVYIGRIEPDKIGNMIEYFLAYKTQYPSDTKLVLIGKGSLQIEPHPDIITLGFVSEHIKNTVLINARGLIIASRFESLSIVTLESMAAGVPVIASDESEVLKTHIQMSQAGFIYKTQDHFNHALEYLRDPPDQAMQNKGREYVEKNYSWPQVLKKIRTAIEEKST